MAELDSEVGVMIEKILEQLEEEREYSYADFEEYVTDQSPCLDAEHDDFFHRGLERAAYIVRKVTKEYTSTEHINCSTDSSTGWIPCEIRMPPMPKKNPSFSNKPLELYLVTVKCVDYPVRAFWTGKFFYDGFSKVNVIAWQPLPPVYQPKGD